MTFDRSFLAEGRKDPSSVPLQLTHSPVSIKTDPHLWIKIRDLWWPTKEKIPHIWHLKPEVSCPVTKDKNNSIRKKPSHMAQYEGPQTMAAINTGLLKSRPKLQTLASPKPLHMLVGSPNSTPCLFLRAPGSVNQMLKFCGSSINSPLFPCPEFRAN